MCNIIGNIFGQCLKKCWSKPAGLAPKFFWSFWSKICNVRILVIMLEHMFNRSINSKFESWGWWIVLVTCWTFFGIFFWSAVLVSDVQYYHKYFFNQRCWWVMLVIWLNIFLDIFFDKPCWTVCLINDWQNFHAAKSAACSPSDFNFTFLIRL